MGLVNSAGQTLAPARWEDSSTSSCPPCRPHRNSHPGSGPALPTTCCPPTAKPSNRNKCGIDVPPSPRRLAAGSRIHIYQECGGRARRRAGQDSRPEPFIVERALRKVILHDRAAPVASAGGTRIELKATVLIWVADLKDGPALSGYRRDFTGHFRDGASDSASRSHNCNIIYKVKCKASGRAFDQPV